MNPRTPSSNGPVQKRLPRVLFGAVLLPILFFLGWYVHWRWSNASAIRRLEAKAKKNGEPLTCVELAAMYPPIPDNQNGAVVLMQLWEKDDPIFWKLFREGTAPRGLPQGPQADPILPYIGSKSELVRRTKDIEAASLQAANTYLQKERKHFDRVRTALQYPHFWFPISIEDGREIVLPHLARIKFEALNFSLEALVASEHADTDSAITAIENTAYMGNTLASEPVHVSQAVRLACYDFALTDMERLLSRYSLSLAQLDRLAKLVSELRAVGGLRLAVIGDRAEDLDTLTDLEQAPVLRLIKPMQSNRRVLLTVYDHLISLGDADKPDVLRACDAIWDNYTNAIAKTNAISSDELSSGMLLGPTYAAHRFARFEIHRRAAIIALAVERYRVEHQGNLPKQLSDITPQYLKAIPSDPFDGTPLRFRRLQTGFVVGPDGVESGDWERKVGQTFTIER